VFNFIWNNKPDQINRDIAIVVSLQILSFGYGFFLLLKRARNESAER